MRELAGAVAIVTEGRYRSARLPVDHAHSRFMTTAEVYEQDLPESQLRAVEKLARPVLPRCL